MTATAAATVARASAASRSAFRLAWLILTVSLTTDFALAGGGAILTAMTQAQGQRITWPTVGMALATAFLLGLRTVQQELKSVGIKLADLLRAELQAAGWPTTPEEDRP